MSKQNWIRGAAAIEAARGGRALYVLSPQHGWLIAGAGVLERAERLPAHALWIYGVSQ